MQQDTKLDIPTTDDVQEQSSDERVDAAIEEALTLFNADIIRGVVKDARRADEHVGDIAGEVAERHQFENGSDEYDYLVSALNVRASEAFPGAWEDYPKS